MKSFYSYDDMKWSQVKRKGKARLIEMKITYLPENAYSMPLIFFFFFANLIEREIFIADEFG